MIRKRNPFPGVGNQPTTDRHGKKRWRLRKTLKGRKEDVNLPGPYGSAEFRAACRAADTFVLIYAAPMPGRSGAPIPSSDFGSGRYRRAGGRGSEVSPDGLLQDQLVQGQV